MERGFIQIIVIFVLVVVVLSLLGISLRSVSANPFVRENFKYIREISKWLWDSYLGYPTRFLWGIFVDYIWDVFIKNMERLKQGTDRNLVEPPSGYQIPAEETAQ